MPATTSLAFKTRMTPTLSILMVNYKTRDLTLASLRTVFAETSATDFELILVDNDSGDGSFGGRRSPGEVPPAAQPRHRSARRGH